MSTYLVSTNWQHNEQDFNYETYDRTFTIKFSGGTHIQATNPKEYFGKLGSPNPEELLLSALSGCYMQTFLAVVCKHGYIVDNYADEVIGETGKNEHNRNSITSITLHPKIKFSGSKIPDNDVINKMRDKAHENCFISNSINSQLNIEITAS